MKPIPPGATANFQLKTGSRYCEPGRTNMRDSASDTVLAMFVGCQRNCWSPKNAALVSIDLYCAMRLIGPDTWTQPELEPGVTRLISSKASSPCSAVQRSPEIGSNAMPNPLRMP